MSDKPFKTEDQAGEVHSRANEIIAMPHSLFGLYHNGKTAEPCDMIEGPCACGAWHHFWEWEEAVRDVVAKENPWVREHRFSIMGCHLNGVGERCLQDRSDKLTAAVVALAEAVAAERARCRREEVGPYKYLSEQLDKLLACYRIGKNPGNIIDRVTAARETLATVEKIQAENP